MTTMTTSKLTRPALWAMLVFAGAITSGWAFRPLGPPYATLLWKLCWIGLCFLGLGIVHRMGPSEALRELGLQGSLRTGLSVGLIVALPMLALLMVTLPLNPALALAPLLSTGVLAPVSEELLFRGYLFFQLYRRAGWSLAAAVVTTAVLFGLAHLGALAATARAASLLGEVAMVAAGGAFYAWLLVRWNCNLWVPIAAHGFMNLSCELCGCDERPGTWPINLGRLLAVAAAVGLTMAHESHRAGDREPSNEGTSQTRSAPPAGTAVPADHAGDASGGSD